MQYCVYCVHLIVLLLHSSLAAAADLAKSTTVTRDNSGVRVFKGRKRKQLILFTNV